MRPHKFIVTSHYGEVYRLHRRNECPVCNVISPVNLSDEGSAREFVRRLNMGHSDGLKLLHEMNAITPNSDISLDDCQRDIARLAWGWHRAITFYRFEKCATNIDFSGRNNNFPVIKASSGMEYHFVPAGILLLSDPNPDDVKFFRLDECQQAREFIETLDLSDEQLTAMMSGLKLWHRPTRAGQISELTTALATGQIVVVKIHESITSPPKRKGPEDLPVEYYTPGPPTLGPHEEPGYVSPENPHPGLHNQEALTPDLKTSAESFKPTRQVDMRNLSPEDEVVSEVLDEQGWKERKIKQVLKSGDDFTETSYRSGDKIYGFNTAGRARKLDNSAYLLDEAGMKEVKSKYFKQGHWDKEGVKDYLALPCFNAASQIDVMEVTEPTTGIKSTIGKASELLRYDGTDGYTTGTIGKIMGGGGTQTTLDTSTLKLLPGK